MKSEVPSEAELIAFADNRLGEPARSMVAAYLTRDADAARWVAAMRDQNRALEQALAPVIGEPIPPSLVRAAARPNWWPTALAASLALVLGLGLGTQIDELPGERAPTLALAAWGDRSLVAHQALASAAQPVLDAPMPASREGWMARAAGLEIAPPDLSASGYQLLGGRLMLGDGQPAVLLVYKGAADDRLALLVERDPGAATPMVKRARGRMTAFAFRQGEVRVALAGTREAATVEGIARQVRDQIG